MRFSQEQLNAAYHNTSSVDSMIHDEDTLTAHEQFKAHPLAAGSVIATGLLGVAAIGLTNEYVDNRSSANVAAATSEEMATANTPTSVEEATQAAGKTRSNVTNATTTFGIASAGDGTVEVNETGHTNNPEARACMADSTTFADLGLGSEATPEDAVRAFYEADPTFGENYAESARNLRPDIFTVSGAENVQELYAAADTFTLVDDFTYANTTCDTTDTDARGTIKSLGNVTRAAGTEQFGFELAGPAIANTDGTLTVSYNGNASSVPAEYGEMIKTVTNADGEQVTALLFAYAGDQDLSNTTIEMLCANLNLLPQPVQSTPERAQPVEQAPDEPREQESDEPVVTATPVPTITATPTPTPPHVPRPTETIEPTDEPTAPEPPIRTFPPTETETPTEEPSESEEPSEEPTEIKTDDEVIGDTDEGGEDGTAVPVESTEDTDGDGNPDENDPGDLPGTGLPTGHPDAPTPTPTPDETVPPPDEPGPIEGGPVPPTAPAAAPTPMPSGTVEPQATSAPDVDPTVVPAATQVPAPATEAAPRIIEATADTAPVVEDPPVTAQRTATAVPSVPTVENVQPQQPVTAPAPVQTVPPAPAPTATSGN